MTLLHSHSAKHVQRVLAMLLTVLAMVLNATAADKSREQVIKIVAQVQRADYEGDRAALKRLYADLAPFAQKKELASRVRYWRGFALWRMAINGFNDKVDPKELEENLKQAIDEFEASAGLDPDFPDAKIGAASCLGVLAFMHRTDQAQLQAYIARIAPLVKAVQASSPENPRLYWILGPVYWNRPAENGGGPAKAIENYNQGLDAIRKNKTTAVDPLDPSWGEPELLMSLAWSTLNQPAPDPEAAEKYANSALALVPYWHYVRDILLPQIRKAREKPD
ncbi:MAG TPA: hypothetical protein VI685_11625 [Candidatus Angelobacter sp.]